MEQRSGGSYDTPIESPIIGPRLLSTKSFLVRFIGSRVQRNVIIQARKDNAKFRVCGQKSHRLNGNVAAAGENSLFLSRKSVRAGTMSHRIHWMLCLLAGALVTTRAAERQPVSFNMQVRPVLSDRCWSCHGPDENKRKAKLRLDTKEGALAETDGYFIIKPGEPEKSEVYKRLTSSDPDEQMPPPDSHLSVSKEEVELIRRWIAEGANWEKHWAYIAPRKHGVLQTEDSLKAGHQTGGWGNEIDGFILARLGKEGLKPSGEASRERLIRRLAFDLTGLPPTLEQIDAFVADKSENAYEKV